MRILPGSAIDAIGYVRKCQSCKKPCVFGVAGALGCLHLAHRDYLDYSPSRSFRFSTRSDGGAVSFGAPLLSGCTCFMRQCVQGVNGYGSRSLAKAKMNDVRCTYVIQGVPQIPEEGTQPPRFPQTTPRVHKYKARSCRESSHSGPSAAGLNI